MISLAWTLDLPLLVDLLRGPGLNMMSHNRFVFAAAFAVLSMAAVGLEVLATAAAGKSPLPQASTSLCALGGFSFPSLC